MEITVTFPGGKRVDAEMSDSIIHTDQSRQAGGEGSAPEPFALFLASIATCAGIYVLGFCQARDIPTDGIRLVQQMDFESTPPQRLERVRIEIQVPPSFPERYLPAVQRAADLCAVKKVIMNPPEFQISTQVVG